MDPIRGGAEVLHKQKRAAFAARFFRFPRFSEALANQAQELVEVPTDEHESEDSENGNDGKNESVFRETLSFLAVKDEEHVASFHRRRLAFVATDGQPGA